MTRFQSSHPVRRFIEFPDKRNPIYALERQVSSPDSDPSQNQRVAQSSSQLSIADQCWLDEFDLFIRQSLTSTHLNIPDIAEAFAMSESTLLRKVKQVTGNTPSKYFQQIRLQEARRLLEIGYYHSIQEVSDAVGFRNRSSFTRSFKQFYGKTPSNYLFKSS